MKKILLTGLFIGFSLALLAQKHTFTGQAEGWATVNPFNDFSAQLGGRYLPTYKFKYEKKDTFKLNFEASAHLYGNLNYENSAWNEDGKLKPYRIYARYSNKQFEIRAGLQKISFGSATMLRPLMWFDQMDPRDPLQITDGVYALLARYYLINNTNFWLWTLYGNENPKGWEIAPSTKTRPEIGGRIQLPIGSGELGFTYHNREANFGESQFAILNPLGKAQENKAGIDGKWDWHTGLWFEAMVRHQKLDGITNPVVLQMANEYFNPWLKQINIGIDYTFGIGNGIVVMHELLWNSSSKEVLGNNEDIFFSALSANYPLGIINSITAMVYYDYTNESWYRFINWQQQYDHLSLYVMLFWNPDKFQIYQNVDENNLFSGKGFQVKLVFNH